MKGTELIVFDIDGTLTRSKTPIDSQMALLLCKLLGKYKVAIISGARYEQFQRQVVDHLICPEEKKKNLFILPATGTVFCDDKDEWVCHYDTQLSEEEKGRIIEAFETIFEESGFEKPAKIYGETVEDRGAQLNFSAFGQDAPIELKESWDPRGEKRVRMMEILKSKLPNFSMSFGGTTSIEVTRPGIDKAYGLKKLMKETGVAKEKILYVGDRLTPGGNDAPVLSLGITCLGVKNPEETKALISKFLES